jgi:hypothetical protein
MGHANFLGADIDDALKRAETIKAGLLRGGR